VAIALVSTPFVAVPPVAYGGTELIVAMLARELAARGQRVILYATGDSKLPGVQIEWLYPEAIWPPNEYHELNHAQFALRDILRRNDVELVHTHISAATAFADLIDVPMICTLHHAYDEALHELYAGAATESLTLVAISRRQRDLLGHDLEAEVVHHGLDAESYPLGRGGPGAAFVGRFAQEKGVAHALDAARRARVPLRLAGRPHWKDEEYFRAEIEPRLRRHGMVWMGELSHAPKVALLGSSLATLFPIEWEEPFGLVMIESMLCGTPVISFARGSAAEVVDPGVTGWVVEDLDEMVWRLRELAARPWRFDRERCRARAVTRFSSAAMTDNYQALYAAAIQRQRWSRNERAYP